MVWFKQCSKCRGDLYLESDRYGAYVACIQCGAIAKEVPNTAQKRPAAAAPAGAENEIPQKRFMVS